MEINYVIQTPKELLEKFLFESKKISPLPEKFDFFNFVVTAAILSEWIYKHYEPYVSQDFIDTLKGKSDTGLPKQCDEWINDKTCLPNAAQGATRHILNSLRICWNITNATKHYKWKKSHGIEHVGDDAPINDWYNYFFTPVGDGIFIRFHEENYSIEQIKNILVQFYPKLIESLESKSSKSAPYRDRDAHH